jgi:hypothetical protein
MPRLLVHVEGQTEETFVNEVLGRHLYAVGFHSVGARYIGGARRRGGICGWAEARQGIVNHLRQDGQIFVTTMVDYYGLPQSDGREWPGRAAAALLRSDDRASFVESHLSQDVREILDTNRFIPFVVMHEFEALLFSDCAAFGRAIGQPELALELAAIRDGFDTPEGINDSPESAPSKRILALKPSYEKPLLGALAALEIGLEKIRAECPHFDGWVRRLESLVT